MVVVVVVFRMCNGIKSKSNGKMQTTPVFSQSVRRSKDLFELNEFKPSALVRVLHFTMR